jgi:predicted Zn-dependent protease
MNAATDRLPLLEKMLAQQPNDPFLLYGIAMEHKKRGDHAAAIDFLNRTLSADPNYCYAYYQLGQVRELMGDTAAARDVYARGIEIARVCGDAHAQSELQGALEMLG